MTLAADQQRKSIIKYIKAGEYEAYNKDYQIHVYQASNKANDKEAIIYLTRYISRKGVSTKLALVQPYMKVI